MFIALEFLAAVRAEDHDDVLFINAAARVSSADDRDAIEPVRDMGRKAIIPCVLGVSLTLASRSYSKPRVLKPNLGNPVIGPIVRSTPRICSSGLEGRQLGSR
jgi:hypothetical protein